MSEAPKDLEAARQAIFRNVAFCVHWAMWKRGMSEQALVERSKVSAELVRAVLIGGEHECSLSQLAEIVFALDMRIDLRLDAIEVTEPQATPE